MLKELINMNKPPFLNNLKKIILLAVLLSFSLVSYSQSPNERREKAISILSSVYYLLFPDVSIISALNDTGIIFGGDFPSGNNTDCTGVEIQAQDCTSGRDVTNNDNSDGHAGFSFTKLDANGDDLPADVSSWSCVRDNVTERIWEVKTNNDTEDLHYMDHLYSWYDDNPQTNGGSAGALNGGSCLAGVSCDTQGFTNAVNQAGLCGYNDWRMPTISELQSIVNYNTASSEIAGVAAIDNDFFPNTATLSSFVWSASPLNDGSNNAWSVSFNSGDVTNFLRSFGRRVRLVRGRR